MNRRRRVAITGVGVLNAALSGGSAALAAWLSDPTMALGARPAAPVVDAERLAGLIDGAEARRMSRVCQLTVAAARLALADAGLEPAADLDLVVGTQFGDLRSTVEFANGFLSRGPTGLSPLLFPNTVMNTMAAATAIAVQARGSTLTLAVPAVAGELAIARAAAGIEAGRLGTVLAGGVDQADELVHRVARRITRSPDTHGEGAAFLVLEPHDAALSRDARLLGEIRGAAWRAIAARPCGVGRRMDAPAVDEALERAGLMAGDIGWLYMSASGDDPRDRWEAAALRARFGERTPPSASLAHGLGRNAGLGALHVAAAAWTARCGVLPGTPPGPSRRGAVAGPGLVHGLARGGTHVVLAVDR
jgi:3-oxoacyl-[acyl-carrier-protein] synthase II